MPALSLGSRATTRFTFNQAQFLLLTTGRLSPVGRDLEARSIRVVREMKANASGRPGPNIRSRNLYEAITSRMGTDGQGLFVQVGPLGSRMIRRNFNYALILEGFFDRGGSPPPGHYPFMERSLKAAA